MSALWVLACRHTELFRDVDIGGIVIMIFLLIADGLIVSAFLK